MKLISLSGFQSVNIIASILIAFFIVFPDMIRYLENDTTENNSYEIKLKPEPPFGIFDRNGRPNDMMNPGKQPAPIHKELPPGKRIGLILYDIVFYFLLSYILLLFNSKRNKPLKQKKIFWRQSIWLFSLGSLFICIFFVFLNAGLEYIIYGASPDHNPLINGMILFKCLFAGIVSVLIAMIIKLTSKQNRMILAMEQLRAENIQTKYDALNSQVNPHLFFNSLNALASLIREKDYSGSLNYIQELSDLFRYLIRKNQNEMVPLKNEIKLMNSYRYLLQIRYKKNLIFKIEIDDRFLNEFQLPVLSLQPLAENAVKHNVISNDKPLTIHIYTLANNAIVIENKIQTKLEGPKSSEIGLENLNNRFKLLTGKEIEIKKENMMFSVTLPLMKIEKKNESNNH